MGTRARVKSVGKGNSTFAVGDIVEVLESREYGFDFYALVNSKPFRHTGLWKGCAHLANGEWEEIDADGNVLAEKENE